MTDKPQYQYDVPRSQLLVAAFVLFFLAAVELWRGAGSLTRRSVVAALVLIVVGFGLLWSASTIETWCAPTQAAWSAGERGLTWEAHSWHEPTLRDCLSR